jgi:hypothetical protein
VIADKIIIEPEKNTTSTDKTGDLVKNPTLQFGPANPPAKTVGMNRTNFNENITQQQKNRKKSRKSPRSYCRYKKSNKNNN